MANEDSKVDFLTATALFDEQEYLCGYTEGRLDVNDDDNADSNHKKASKMGFLKGYAISLETNFYKEIVKESSQSSSVQSERIQKKVRSVIDTVDKLGISNNETIDYEEEIGKIRSNFKAISSNMIVASFSKIKDGDQKKSW
jgi:hypothetical protein